MADIRTACNVLQQFNDDITYAPEGSTIHECYQLLNGDPILRPMIRAFHRGLVQEDWSTITREGEPVIFVIVPAGGEDGNKGIMAMVAMVAIMVLTRMYVPGMVEGMTATGATVGAMGPVQTLYGMTYATATNVAIAGVSLVGSLVVGAVFKPSIPGINSQVVSNMDSPEVASPMITGQSNSARNMQVIPVLFGKHTVYPDVAAHAYIEKRGCKQVLHAVYCVGFGPLEVDLSTVKLGGVPWSLLKESNPGMQIYYKDQMINNFVPKWYKGVRDVDPVGLILNIYDGTEYPVVVTPTAGANEVYLDVIFPAGIFDFSDNGNLIKHTVVIRVEKKVGGNWEVLEPHDVLSSSEDLICIPIAEDVAQGKVTTEASFDNQWGILSKVLSTGTGTNPTGSIILNSYSTPMRLCHDGGGSNSKKMGWNVGIEGRMSRYEAVCNKSNLKGAKPVILSGEKGWMLLEDAAHNGAVYYTIGIESHPLLNDNGKLAEGYYSMSFELYSPRAYDLTVPPDRMAKITNAISQAYIVPYDAAGIKIQEAIARGPKLAISENGTRFKASVRLSKNNGYSRLQFAVSFDVYDRTATSRRTLVRLKDSVVGFQPDTKTEVVEEESRIKIKVPQLGGTIANSQEAPVKGDMLYFGVAQEHDCSNCVPLGHRYVVDRVWVEDEWGNVGSKPVYAEYVRKIGSTGHLVMNITKTGNDVKGNQHFGIYEVGLDDPISYAANMIFTERLIPAGFKITGDYRAPINMGLLVKYYEQFRLTKTTTAPNTATETATLSSVSSIRTGGALVVVPNEENLVYTLIEVSVPANEMLGSTLKPLSVTVHKMGRDYGEDYYDADKIHDPTDPNGQTSRAADRTENPAWTYLNVLTGNAGARVLGLGWGHYLKDFIDLESFREWAKMCTREGFRCATILTGYTTVGDLLVMIAATGRGRPTFKDGKHGIVFDGDPRYFTKDANGLAVPIERQMITPENSWDGSSRMAYMADTHALKVQYLDFETRKTAEVIIYAPDFAQDGNSFYANPKQDPPWKAQKFETMSIPAVNHWQQAAKLGEYFMDEVRLRRERVVRTLDIENLISQEGDIIAVADDVMKLGGKPGWISETSGPNGNIILTLKDPMPKYPDPPPGGTSTFGIKIRCYDTASGLPRLTTQLPAIVDPHGNGDNTQVRVTVPSDYGVRVGYMVLWGMIERISSPFQISAIKYSADLTATLEMVEYYADPLNYEGDRIVIPESPITGEVDTPKGIQLSLIIKPATDGGGWVIKYMVSWQHVPAIIDGGYYLVEFTDAIRPAVTVENVYVTASYYRDCDDKKGTMGVKVYAVDTFGNRSEPAIDTALTHPPEFIPPAVTEFGIDVRQDGSVLTWKEINNEHVTGYEIRWSEDISIQTTWEDAEKVLVKLWQGNSFRNDHRSGRFYIKTVGMCGIVSNNAAIIISDVITSPGVSEVFESGFYIAGAGQPDATLSNCVNSTDVNGVVHATCDLMLEGVKIGTTYDLASLAPEFNYIGPSLMIDTIGVTRRCFRREGWIYLNPDYLLDDLPRNAEAVLNVSIGGSRMQLLKDECSFHTQNKVSLYDKPAWGLIYYRTWTGATIPTGGWMLMQNGDYYIKEHFQIALKLYSSRGDWTTILHRGYLNIQYYTRTESAENVDCPATGKIVSYNHNFMSPPSISIMGQDLRVGDTWKISGPSTNGFVIKFYDSSGRAKAASFDWIASGFGVKR